MLRHSGLEKHWPWLLQLAASKIAKCLAAVAKAVLTVDNFKILREMCFPDKASEVPCDRRLYMC